MTSDPPITPEPPSTPEPHAPVRAESRDRWVSIVEAVLLSVVTLTAAWSGYAAAAWGGESSLGLADAQDATTEATRADLDARAEKNFDLSTFDAWFAAYVVHDKQAMALAERRFRPELEVAFKAWLATDPTHNPHAPRGPTYMPEYQPPEVKAVAEFDRKAREAHAAAIVADDHSSGYVRITVFLASVLFLVGISTHFPSRNVRYGLNSLGAILLVFSLVQLVQLPGLP